MKCLRDSHDFSAPRYWAPFVLIGDDVKIELKKNLEEIVSREFLLLFFLLFFIKGPRNRRLKNKSLNYYFQLEM